MPVSRADNILHEATVAANDVAMVRLDASRSTGLQIAVLLKKNASTAKPELVAFRGTIESISYLGCLVDLNDDIHEWLEIIVEDASGLAGHPAASRCVLNNITLNQRWEAMVTAAADLPLGTIIHTAWQQVSPAPFVIDSNAGRCSEMTDEKSGVVWKICQDDALLTQAGYPPYSKTLNRVLYTAGSGQATQFSPVHMIGNEGGQDGALPGEAPASNKGEVLFNPRAGRMLVRICGDLTFESYADHVGGQAIVFLNSDHAISKETGQADRSLNSPGSRLLPFGRSGGKYLLETLYLKLRLILQCMDSVRSQTERSGRPFLNLSAESFAISLAKGAIELPWLWTSRPILLDGGSAVPLNIPESNRPRFVSLSEQSLGGYLPAVRQGLQGRAPARILVTKQAPEGFSIDLRLITWELRDIVPSDLVWLSFFVGDRKIEFHAEVIPDQRDLPGQKHLRTLGRSVDPLIVKAIESMTGVEVAGVSYEVLPMLSSAFDLHSLGVLAVRALLTNEGSSLPEMLDRVRSLGGAAGQVSAAKDVSLAVGQVFESDPRWGEWLSAWQLAYALPSTGVRPSMIPDALWNRVLGWVLRMLLGNGSFSYYRHPGDSAAGVMHRAYDEPIRELTQMVQICKSLLLGDWRDHREVRSILEGLLESPPATNPQAESKSRSGQPRA